MAGPRTQGAKIGVAAALAVLGFAASFALARLTDDDAANASPSTQAPLASVAVLPPEAARLVRLSPAGAVPALRAAPTTVAQVRQPTPSSPASPAPQAQPEPQPEPTTAPAPQPEPEPEPDPTIPPATTYIP